MTEAVKPPDHPAQVQQPEQQPPARPHFVLEVHSTRHVLTPSKAQEQDNNG